MEWIKRQPIDIINKILYYCDIKNQINFISTCKKFNNIIYDFDLLNISMTTKISNKIIKQKKFLNIKKLCAKRNRVDQNGIIGLDLIELNACNNLKIFDVSFMKKLQKLNACRKCGIDQNGISGLNLIELVAVWNPKIIDVS